MTSNPPPARFRLPEGVVDHPPARAAALAAAQAEVARVFGLAGYQRVYTPLFELSEVLEAGLSEDERRSAFRLVDPARGEVVLLRPDFTAQVARLAATHLGSAPRPLRLFYQGRVARALDPQGRGLRRRDVFHSGIELVGAPGRWPEVEIIEVALDALAAFERTPTLDLGHAGIVQALLEAHGGAPEVQAALSSKDVTRLEAIAPRLVPLAHLYGDRGVLDEARRTLADAPAGVHAALDELDAVADRVAGLAPDVPLVFDLGAQRNHGYYTGLFFAAYVPGAPDAVLRGGRYDRLLERFGAPEPAVGMGVDLGLVIAARPPAAARRGVVVAEASLDTPTLRAVLDAARARGERAVAVPAETATAYARAHGFRAVVHAGPAGPVETAVADTDDG